MNLVCAGISHQTAPLAVRERLQLTPDEIRGALRRLRTLGCEECVLFSARDRTEVYAFGEAGSPRVDLLVEFLQGIKGSDESIPSRHFYSFSGEEATGHLLRVSTSLESMIAGDLDIVSRMEEGVAIADQSGTTDFLITRLFQSAFGMCERVQRETLIAEGAISVSRAAVELAQRIFDDLSQKKALIVGTGETAQSTARLLITQGIGSLAITNRDQERTEQFAASIRATSIPFESFREHLSRIDIVIFSLQSEPYLLTSTDVKNTEKSRQGQPLFLIDCGIPHNVDPFAGELENVFLYDLDTLNKMVSENITQRRLQVPKVESLITEELELLTAWYASLEATPTIAALTSLIEQIRSEEINKDLHRISQGDRALVDALTKRITARILQLPAASVKAGQDEKLPDRMQSLNIIRKLFGLETGKRDPDKGT